MRRAKRGGCCRARPASVTWGGDVETMWWKALTLSLSSPAPGWGHPGLPEATCPSPNPLMAHRDRLRGPRGTQRSLAGWGTPILTILEQGWEQPNPKKTQRLWNCLLAELLPCGRALWQRVYRCPAPSVHSRPVGAEGHQKDGQPSSKAVSGQALTHHLILSECFNPLVPKLNVLCWMWSLSEWACKDFGQKFNYPQQEGKKKKKAMKVVWASTVPSTREPVCCLSEAGWRRQWQIPTEQLLSVW